MIWLEQRVILLFYLQVHEPNERLFINSVMLIWPPPTFMTPNRHFTYFLSSHNAGSHPAVMAEWLEQQLCNIQRQQSCLDPGSNPARDFHTDCSKLVTIYLCVTYLEYNNTLRYNKIKFLHTTEQCFQLNVFFCF